MLHNSTAARRTCMGVQRMAPCSGGISMRQETFVIRDRFFSAHAGKQEGVMASASVMGGGLSCHIFAFWDMRRLI